MIIWMAWSTLVSLLLGFSALAAERPLRATGRSARGVWGLAILGGLALQAWAFLRTGEALTQPPAGSGETASVTLSMLTELQTATASLPALLDRYETVALVAWNAALWWSIRRLRAAVEIDCDARVLNAGASPSAYGALLLELTSTGSDHRLPVATFAKPPSLLERRLTMIVSDVRHGVPVGSLATLAVCGLLVVVACESAPTLALPTQGEEAAVVDVAADTKTITLNGQASVEGEQPLIFVDGIRMSDGLPELEPESIDRIEVIKGEAAYEQFGDEASGGVIQIFLKAGTAQSKDEPNG